MFNLVPWKKKGNVKVRRNDLMKPSCENAAYPLARLRNEFDRMWDDFWDEWATVGPSYDGSKVGLRFDVDNQSDEYVLRADLPGFDDGDIEVNIAGNLVTVRARQAQQSNDKGWRTCRYSAFTESFSLPQGVDSAGVTAQYHHGVLAIHLPKRADGQARRIPVHSAN